MGLELDVRFDGGFALPDQHDVAVFGRFDLAREDLAGESLIIWMFRGANTSPVMIDFILADFLDNLICASGNR